MKVKQSILVLGLALLAFSGAGYAEPEAGGREFILSGTGESSSGFETTHGHIALELGQFTSKATELGIRQHVGFSEHHDVAFSGKTFLFADYHFDHNEWQPFVGASIGVEYGEDVDEAFLAGPEAGVKYYVMHHTFITGRVGYLFNVEHEVDDGAFIYELGIGFGF